MTAFTIHATKDGDTVSTVRIGPTVTVAKARTLLREGCHQCGWPSVWSGTA